MRKIMSRVALLTTASLLAISAGWSAALSADLPKSPVLVATPATPPAVSAPNAKIGIFGGSIDGVHGWGVDGSVSVPLQQQWGLQIDGLGGSAGGASFWGVAGHLFTRDPRSYLLGVYASWVNWSPVGAQVGKVGIEAELYRGSWTFSGLIGEQSGNFSGITGAANIALYLGDNLKIDGGYRFLNGIGNIGNIGIEWQHDTSGLALFARGDWGQNGYSTILGGVKFYAGPPKSLIRRNREDDPTGSLALDLFHLPPVTCPVGVSADGCLLLPK
jgi:hypothetical protein